MKNVILSADGDCVVYSVPDEVADSLREYCIEFCDEWLWKSPDAKKYRSKNGVCYNEEDFIEYLNKWLFPNQISKFVENIGWISKNSQIPQKYKDCPMFNF